MIICLGFGENIHRGDNMNFNRVKEVLTSEQEIPVHYHGDQVWIESIEDTSSMAMISNLGNNGERQLVSIDALKETREKNM